MCKILSEQICLPGVGQRLVTSAPRSDPSTLLMTRLVYWLEPSRRDKRTTPGQLRVHTPYDVRSLSEILISFIANHRHTGLGF